MSKETGRNTMIIVGLLVAIIVMSVGYAVLAQTLTINGTAGTGDASWNIAFDTLAVDTATSTAGLTETHEILSTTTASFDVTLNQPGDKIVYNVTIANNGTIDATYTGFTGVTDVNAVDPTAIQYTVVKTDATEDLLNGDTDTFTITVEWLAASKTVDANTTSKTATIAFDYVQKTA